MSKKNITLVIISSLVFGALGSWIFTRYIVPKLNTIPFLVKHNLAPEAGPLVINTREEIRVNEGSDSIAAIQTVKPWLVSVLANGQFVSGGIIISSDGLIATTTAVPQNANISVVLDNGTVLPAVYKASDTESPLVFLKAQGNDLSVASFGAPKDLQLGQRIIVLSPSLGEYQATDVVSYLSSEMRNIPYNQVLSADQISRTFGVDNTAGLPEGSAVISLDGNVQGLLSRQIVSSDTIKSALASYFSNNKIVRDYVGVHYQYVPKSLASLSGSVEGVVLKHADSKTPAVAAQSPAAQAGLAEGDIIYEVSGTQINFDNSFEELIQKYSPGQTVLLTVMRNRQIIKVPLTIGSK